MLTETTTGATRYRVETRLFRDPLVVLQVWVHIKGKRQSIYGLWYDVDYYEWRDARVQDVTTETNHVD